MRGKSETNELCFKCHKAFGGCSWSDEWKPPKGSVYETVSYKRSIWANGKLKYIDADSYHIISCPEFEEDKPIRPKDIDKDGVYNLLAAMCKGAKEDYKLAKLKLYIGEWECDRATTNREAEKAREKIQSAREMIFGNATLLPDDVKRILDEEAKAEFEQFRKAMV